MDRLVINVDSRDNSPVHAGPSGNTRSSKTRAKSQPQPRPRPKAKRITPPSEIIELTDSDSGDDNARAGPSQPNRAQQYRASRRAGSSQGKAKRAVLLPPPPPPPRVNAQVAQPVYHLPSPPGRQPLFLPDVFHDGPALFEPPGPAEPPPAPPVPAPAPAVAVPLALAPPPASEVVAAPAAAAEVPHAGPPPQEAGAPLIVEDDEIPFGMYVAQVIEIIPDVLPAHVFSLIEQYYPNHKDKVVEHILHTLFENPDYPKAEAKGKGKRKREELEELQHQQQRAVKVKVDYGDKNRKREVGDRYDDLAIGQLTTEFAMIPSAHIHNVFKENNRLYAPTYLALREQQQRVPRPFEAMSRPRKSKGKRVQKHDEELDRETAWVRTRLEEEEMERAKAVEEETRMQEEGGGIECGCCFCEYPFDKMVQCPETHLFCTACMMTYAETKLGEHDARIVCMDQSGCKLAFPESELRRFLTPKLLELYERVKQRKEIEAAGLEGLEECPFCEYKVVIENEQERLFRCENEGCGAVTCRACKKPDHLPKSCQEVEDDKKLDVRHAIEEAMTRALMRNCPKCQKAFIKEMGCNKMTCPNCGTLSCYICRKVIHGYDHFNQQPPYTQKADPNKCALWDATGVEGRHSDEVTAAAKKVMEEYRRAHPEMDAKDLHVDLPPPPPAPGPSRGLPHVHVPAGRPPGIPYVHIQHLQHQQALQAARHQVIARQDAQLDVLHVHHHPQPLHHPQMGPPVFNFQVHINHNQPQAGPAYPQPAVAVAPPAPIPAAVAPVRARVRRSTRTRARR